MKTTEFRKLIKECVTQILKEYDDYQDQLTKAYRVARKEKNPEKMLYYRQAFNKSAVADWDRFKGSWAYEQWKKQYSKEIEAVAKELKRFSYLGEGVEPYDPQSDQFGYAPRDRTEPVEKPQIDKDKIRKLNKILVTCGEMQKRVHALTDDKIRFGIKDIQETVIELMKELGAR